MNREEILALLRVFKQEHAEQYGILEIGLFGSLARDEAGEDSDVDICVVTRTPDPYPLVHAQAALEALAQRHVDIVRVRTGMNPYLRERIEREAYYV